MITQTFLVFMFHFNDKISAADDKAAAVISNVEVNVSITIRSDDDFEIEP